MNAGKILDSLAAGNPLSADEFATLITVPSRDGGDNIAAIAREITDNIHGNKVFARGLLEVGNRCRNNCIYCGIRAENKDVDRYWLKEEEILNACRMAHLTGFRTFVIQGGEWPAMDDAITRAVHRFKTEFPDSAVTLSLGERSHEIYRLWKEAGADRYLLRHETASARHYSTLHPEGMKLETRLECLKTLKHLGFQVGAGMMVGSPGQTVETLCDDLLLLQELQPEMVGMGPFIPHHSTPFAMFPAGSIELTLRLISIVRILLPHANIPSTTALASLGDNGRIRGLRAGANVVMPNITPTCRRGDYQLYDNKASMGAESAEGIRILMKTLSDAGFILDLGRGDFRQTTQ